MAAAATLTSSTTTSSTAVVWNRARVDVCYTNPISVAWAIFNFELLGLQWPAVAFSRERYSIPDVPGEDIRVEQCSIKWVNWNMEQAKIHTHTHCRFVAQHNGLSAAPRGFGPVSMIAECAEQRVAWDVHQALGPVRNQQALRVCVCVFLCWVWALLYLPEWFDANAANDGA